MALRLDIESLKKQFSGEIITPEDSQYATARTTFYVSDATPAVIVRPLNSQDIAAAIKFAAVHSLEISVRSGKHSVAGFSTNNDGLVIDMSALNKVEILDAAAGLVRLESGALWGDVANELGKHKLAISSGDTSTVGVGGLTLGGGIGWMVRKYGYAIDSLVGAEVVLADGSVVHASATENPDLFWALRGGGGNFGVVVSFDFKAHTQGQVTANTLMYTPENLKQTITNWRDAMRAADRNLTSFMTLIPGFGPTMPAGAMVMSCYADATEAAAKALQSLQSPGAVVREDATIKDYADMLQEAHPPQGLSFTAKSMYAKTFDDEIIDILSEICCKPGAPIVQLRFMAGAADEVKPEATAVPHRGNELFLYAGFGMPQGAGEAQISQALQVWEKLERFSTGAYSNFTSTNTPEDIAQMYPASTYERLAKVKRQYDPNNIFHYNFNIKPQ